MGSSKQDPANQAKKGQIPREKMWFGRDEKVSEQLQANRSWVIGMRGELLKMKDELQQAILEVTPEIADKVVTEVRLMENRVKAIKLVLADKSDDDLHEELCEAVGAFFAFIVWSGLL